MIRFKTILQGAVGGFSMLLFFQQGRTQNAQPVKFHSFAFGASSVSITDDYGGLILKGIRSGELAYSYSVIRRYHKRSIAIAWNNGQAGNARLNEFRAAYADAFFVIKNKNSRFNTYLGYAISTNAVFITKSNESKRYSWATSTNLSAYSSSAYTWKNNSIFLDLSVPVAGFASRPENNSVYGGNVNELLYESYDNLFFTSFHNLKAASIAVQYSREVSKKISLQAGYRYQYKRLNEDVLFRQVSHGLRAGFSYRLK